MNIDILRRELNTKQRYAMLDTMLMAEKEGLIDHAGICEEVDTFMFEGFDTTSMNIILALAYLANHPQKQQRCVEEITELIPNTGTTISISTTTSNPFTDFTTTTITCNTNTVTCTFIFTLATSNTTYYYHTIFYKTKQ